jgi:hypothetical protein
MKIIIKNPEDGRVLVEKIGNKLIAELLKQVIQSKAEVDRTMEYEKIISILKNED